MPSGAHASKTSLLGSEMGPVPCSSSSCGSRLELSGLSKGSSKGSSPKPSSASNRCLLAGSSSMPSDGHDSASSLFGSVFLLRSGIGGGSLLGSEFFFDSGILGLSPLGSVFFLDSGILG